VGASDRGDDLSSFSNHGAGTVDLVAPGEDVLSTLPVASWSRWSGTSMAAAHVSGAAALLLAAHPEMMPVEVRRTILAGADKVPALTGVVGSGARLDAARSLGLAPSPLALLAGSSSEAYALAQRLLDALPPPAGLGRVLGLWPGSPGRVPVGGGRVMLRYRLSGDARVTFTLSRTPGGRPIARFARDGLAGSNTLYLSLSAAGGRALSPGRYYVGARAQRGGGPAFSVAMTVAPKSTAAAPEQAHRPASGHHRRVVPA
jgi:hypothetical protein